MQKKYHMMWIAASIFRVLGWIILVVGIIGSIIAGAETGGGQGAIIVIFGIFYSIVVGIFIIAAADFYYCIMDIEENTRRPESL